MNSSNIPEVDPEIPSHAVSVYGDGDAMDDFPVLKAFQQYIDAEQAKSRKRLTMLGVFFSILMFVVIGVFVILLVNVSARNQELNDRLVEYAMKDRERTAPVVVQPSQDNSAILALTSKLEEMQRKLAEESRRAVEAEKQRTEAAASKTSKTATASGDEARAQTPSSEALELARLKTQLQQEKNRSAELQAKQKEAELELYRRQHYPELYEPKKPAELPKPVPKSSRRSGKYDDLNALLKDLDDDEAVTYFDDEEDEETPVRKPVKSPKRASATPSSSDEDDEYAIPVEIKGKRAKWRIPEE